jgi:hypothetical protein
MEFEIGYAVVDVEYEVYGAYYPQTFMSPPEYPYIEYTVSYNGRDISNKLTQKWHDKIYYACGRDHDYRQGKYGPDFDR